MLRSALEAEGFGLGGSRTHIVPIVVGDPELTLRLCEAALARRVFAQAIAPPMVPSSQARLRLAVMASHRPEELRAAARVLGQAARAVGFDPRAHAPHEEYEEYEDDRAEPVQDEAAGPLDGERTRLFDREQIPRAA